MSISRARVEALTRAREVLDEDLPEEPVELHVLGLEDCEPDVTFAGKDAFDALPDSVRLVFWLYAALELDKYSDDYDKAIRSIDGATRTAEGHAFQDQPNRR